MPLNTDAMSELFTLEYDQIYSFYDEKQGREFCKFKAIIYMVMHEKEQNNGWQNTCKCFGPIRIVSQAYPTRY